MLIELEELKRKVNNSKYYGTDAWRDILDMAAECEDKKAPTIEPCEDAISRANAIEQIVNTPTLYQNPNIGQEFLEGCATRQNEIIDILKVLSPVAPSRSGGTWIDLFEEIGNTIDTIGEGQETEAFNRGVEACAEIVRRFFGLDMNKESE